MPKRPKIPLLIPYGRGEHFSLRHFSRYTFEISIESRGIVWAARRHLFCEIILKFGSFTAQRVISKNAEEAKNPSAHPLWEGEVADLRHFSRYTFGISIEFRGIVWAAKRHLFCEVIFKFGCYSPESDLEKCR